MAVMNMKMNLPRAYAHSLSRRGINQTKKILELGCGEGMHAYVLSKQRSNEVIGIDSSKIDIETCKRRYPDIDFRMMSADSLQFENNEFDEIYSLDVFEHLDNLEKCIKECSRVLKKRGKLIVNVPAERSEEWLLKIRPSYFEEIHHVRIFRNNDLEEILGKYGFKCILKKPKDFLDHIELYYRFTQTKKSSSQLSIGRWRDSLRSLIVGISMAYFDRSWVFNTPFKYFPIWIITLPVGSVINFIGNKYFPKSKYYEFVKTSNN